MLSFRFKAVLFCFLLFLLLIPIAIANVHVALSCKDNPTCQYSQNDYVFINVALSADVPGATVSAYNLLIRSSDSTPNSFTFLSSSSATDVLFNNQPFTVNEADSACGSYYCGWRIYDLTTNEQISPLQNSVALATIKGKAIGSGSFALTISGDGNSQDENGVYFQGPGTFSNYDSNTLSITVSSGTGGCTSDSGCSGSTLRCVSGVCRECTGAGDCNDNDALTTDTCSSNTCSHISVCQNGDSNCPTGCTISNDDDCGPVNTCGNSVLDTGENCLTCLADAPCSASQTCNDQGQCVTQVQTPVCGNNIIETAEQCDDGNTATETCTYGQASCTVCDATCHSVAGLVANCGDGHINGAEQCDGGTQACPGQTGTQSCTAQCTWSICPSTCASNQDCGTVDCLNGECSGILDIIRGILNDPNKGTMTKIGGVASALKLYFSS